MNHEKKESCPFFRFRKIGGYLVETNETVCGLTHSSCAMPEDDREFFLKCRIFSQEEKKGLLVLIDDSSMRVFPERSDALGRGVLIKDWVNEFKSQNTS